MEPADPCAKPAGMLVCRPAHLPISRFPRNGELLPEVKNLIAQMAKIRPWTATGRMVLATGHADPPKSTCCSPARGAGRGSTCCSPSGRHPAIAGSRKPRRLHRGQCVGHLQDASRTRPRPPRSSEKIGAEPHHRRDRLRPDQQRNPDRLPGAGGARIAGPRHHPAELDLMYKANPAKLLGLPPLEPRCCRRSRRA